MERAFAPLAAATARTAFGLPSFREARRRTLFSVRDVLQLLPHRPLEFCSDCKQWNIEYGPLTGKILIQLNDCPCNHFRSAFLIIGMQRLPYALINGYSTFLVQHPVA